MANYTIPLSWVVSATAVAASQGLQPLQLGTILILTDDTPVQSLTEDYMISRTASSIGQAFGTTSETFAMANAIFAQNPNILNAGGYVIVAPYDSSSETTAEAIQRIAEQIYFEGILTTRDMDSTEATAASNYVEGMENSILFLTDTVSTSLSSGGLFYALKDNKKTRKLLYLSGGVSNVKAYARLFAAAFASRGLSVNYEGQNSTLTMTYKDLAGVPVDTNISETILNTCQTIGADVYCSVEGLVKVLSFKQGGLWFDELANQIWLRTAIQRSVANVLFTTRNKIPQTTEGVATLVNAINSVLNQGIINGMLAPGEWNSSDTFGVLEDFHRCIRTYGYYVYFTPIAEQAQAEREARKCPVISIAAKQAGALEHASILIYLEA
jgi:hypothetical protein